MHDYPFSTFVRTINVPPLLPEFFLDTDKLLGNCTFILRFPIMGSRYFMTLHSMFLVLGINCRTIDFVLFSLKFLQSTSKGMAVINITETDIIYISSLET